MSQEAAKWAQEDRRGRPKAAKSWFGEPEFPRTEKWPEKTPKNLAERYEAADAENLKIDDPLN